MMIGKRFHLICLLFVIAFQFYLVPSDQILEQTYSELEQIILNKQNKFIQDVDRRVLKVVQELGGGIYDAELDAVVPLFPDQVRYEWLKHKNEILERIGLIYPKPTAQSASWENSAKTVNELLYDAKIVTPYFREKCLQIAKQANAVVNFGIKDQSIIKSEASLMRKVRYTSQSLSISEEQAVRKIRDALRGSIIVETPEQISLVVEAIKEFARLEKREVVFINAWEEDRDSGYVGIHAKLLLPICKEACMNRNIIIEIQIHLKCIMDGTLGCVKEREHLLYERIRQGDSQGSQSQTSASNLLYLTALKQCPSLLHSKINHFKAEDKENNFEFIYSPYAKGVAIKRSI